MAFLTWSNMLRILKPVAAGVALAYVATAFLDGPPPVNFQPDNPNSAKQAEIVEPQAELVIEKNIMKLGSLLSVQSEESGPAPLGQSVDGDLELFFPSEEEVEALPSVKGVVESPGS